MNHNSSVQTLPIQVLVATMGQVDHSLISKMNLQTDAVIGNQCERCSNDEYVINGKKYLYLNRPERGVGLNRNTALSHMGNGIITIADDDMTFVDNYESIIQNAFNQLPDADAIIFNIQTIGTDMGRRINSKIKRIHFFNAFNYGATRISIKSVCVKRENLSFHTCFGGGTRYSCGEDTLFIADMLRHHLKIYAYPAFVGSVDQTSSTWFNGYTEKFYFDKGVLNKALSRSFAKPLCLYMLLRHPDYKKSGLTFSTAYRQMCKGMRAYSSLSSFNS